MTPAFPILPCEIEHLFSFQAHQVVDCFTAASWPGVLWPCRRCGCRILPSMEDGESTCNPPSYPTVQMGDSASESLMRRPLLIRTCSESHVRLGEKTMENLRISVIVVCICQVPKVQYCCYKLLATHVILVTWVGVKAPESGPRWDEHTQSHLCCPLCSSNWVIRGLSSRLSQHMTPAKGGSLWAPLDPDLGQHPHVAAAVWFVMLLAVCVCLVHGHCSHCSYLTTSGTAPFLKLL